MSKIMTEGSPAEALLKGIEKPKAGKSKTKAPAKAEVKDKRRVRVNLALTADIAEEIKAQAEAENRSVNNFIEVILRDYLSK